MSRITVSITPEVALRLRAIMLDAKTKLGAETKRLISVYAATVIAERAKAQHGTAGVWEVASSVASGGADGLQSAMKQAFEQARDAIETVRRAPGSEQWPTNEDIAREIMKGIDAKMKRNTSRRSGNAFY